MKRQKDGRLCCALHLLRTSASISPKEVLTVYCTKYHNFSDEELIVEAIVTHPTDDLVVELVERLRVLEAKFEFFRKNGYEED